MSNAIPMIHVRYDGRSWDIPLHEIDLGAMSTDTQIRSAVADHLNVPVAKLRNFTVARNGRTGSLTLHPEATFGIAA